MDTKDVILILGTKKGLSQDELAEISFKLYNKYWLQRISLEKG